ncbi:uncharacterized protein LOC134847686 [Symsagittifera roscoffensis]|uniref:uncharacterized protein LOC134847686 n=1 Tax=Symsagittifera roscoffensis TaxID=84072 RepID=UPI00307CAACF
MTEVKSDSGKQTKVNQTQEWPLSPRTSENLQDDERRALEKAKDYWKISEDLYSESTEWKVAKESEFIQISSTYCESLNLTIFKVKCVMNQNWARALDVLLDYPSCPSWNDTCETCELVMDLSSPLDSIETTLDPTKERSAWVAYMRMSDSVSRMISKRDFCTCFLMEKGQDHALYVGTGADVVACPPLKKCVRGEQSILAVKIEKIDEDSCVMTQLASINFKGMLFQTLVDLSMVKALNTFAQCLRDHANSLSADQNQNSENHHKIPGKKL